MCELFGVSFKKTVEINDYLKIFYSHSNMHPHGWGLACIDGQNIALERESLQASKSNYLKERLSLPVQAKIALAHIRYATIGNVEYCNCHPYSQKDNYSRRWTLIHNGTIFEYPALNKFINIQTGDTDSERILLYIVEQVNNEQKKCQRALTFEERFKLLDTIIASMSSGNKLNLILCDGKYVYVHTNYANSLYFLEKDVGVMFATVPLTDENWQPVPFTQLLAYKDGSLIASGTNHQNEYVENEESIKFLYQIFSDL